MSQRKVPRPLARLMADNPSATILPGKRHWKIIFAGKLVGIYPRGRPAKEGMNDDLCAQLRRAGMTVGSQG
jgi:hypothetical protein